MASKSVQEEKRRFMKLTKAIKRFTVVAGAISMLTFSAVAQEKKITAS
jgi:hypothetical protein